MRQKHLHLLAAVGLFLLTVPIVRAQDFDAKFYYRLTNGWQRDKSLDVINDGETNSKPILAKTAEKAGQLWRITDLGGGNYRLTNGWQKEKSLDVINDGEANNQPILAYTADVMGQFWKITPAGNGSYRLINAWQEDKSLDVINDGESNNQPMLASTASLTGQLWRLRKTAFPVEVNEVNGRPTMRLRSASFSNGAAIPVQHTGEGEDKSPSLTWSNAPAGVQSFALICEDPDYPSRTSPRPKGPWVHWIIYNIPTDVKELPADLPRTAELSEPDGAKQGLNSFEEVGYAGPTPAADRRLDEAARMVSQTLPPHLTIVAALGFCDAIHLSRQYRSRFVVPPSLPPSRT